MNLQQLRDQIDELLQNGVPEETPVVFGYRYGDRADAIVTPEVKSVEEGTIGYSGYYTQNIELEDPDSHKDPIFAIILKS